MTAIDDVLQRNSGYADGFPHEGQQAPPAMGLAVGWPAWTRA